MRYAYEEAAALRRIARLERGEGLFDPRAHLGRPTQPP